MANRKYWSISSDFELYDGIKELSEESRISVTKLLDEAIEDLLFKYGKLEYEQPAPVSKKKVIRRPAPLSPKPDQPAKPKRASKPKNPEKSDPPQK